MSTNRSRRIDRDTAEQLLGGAGVGSEAGQAPLTGHPALVELLAATAVGADDGPLPGEERAMAAFREARRTSAATTASPAPQHRRRTMADTALARAFSAKALAAALAATAIGGVAVAAGTGNLPVLGGPSDDEPPALSGPDAPGSASAGGDASARTGQSGAAIRPSGSAEGAGASGRPSASAGTDPAAVPDLARLCRTFTERVAAGAKAREALALPALQPLSEAAGGPDKVAGYCADAAKADPTPTASKDKATTAPAPTATKSERTGRTTPDPTVGEHNAAAGGTEG